MSDMSDTNQVASEPTVINLDPNNSVQILIKYIELAQKSGAFELKEAEIIKRAIDVLINNVQDQEITQALAINLLIQAVVKGQKHGGSYTLNDAALLHKVITYIIQISQPPQSNQEPVQNVTASNSSVSDVNNDDDDLSSLSEPVPLRPKEI